VSFNSWSCENTKFAVRVKGQGQTRMTHREISLRAFWPPENIFTPESSNSRSRVPSFMRTHFLHFGGFKMWFFRLVKPMLQAYVASCEHILSFMATWKFDSFNSRSKFKGHAKRPNSWSGSKVKDNTNGTSRELTSCILAPWKYIYCWVLKLTFKGTRLRANSFSAFWRRENAIFAESWNPCYKSS